MDLVRWECVNVKVIGQETLVTNWSALVAVAGMDVVLRMDAGASQVGRETIVRCLVMKVSSAPTVAYPVSVKLVPHVTQLQVPAHAPAVTQENTVNQFALSVTMVTVAMNHVPARIAASVIMLQGVVMSPTWSLLMCSQLVCV
uniref:Uncharacterized protein n=1 Tax=Arion vulgaris TaxID=1028688 RepID=A0A0B7A3G4_9EUPU